MSPIIPRKASASRCLRFLTGACTLLILLAGSQLSAQVSEQVSSQFFNRGTLGISANFAPATVGSSYNAVISVSGGRAPYRFFSNGMPPGLELNQKTGSVTGVPTTAGQFTFIVYVGDSIGDHGLGRFNFTVDKSSAVSISVSPTTTTVSSGGTQQFGATVSNTSNTAVTWSASAGTVSSSGLFTAPSVKSNTSVTVTATSVADTTKSASASVTVTAAQGVSITISPTTLSLSSGASSQFTATVSNTSNTAVTWSASAGTVSSSGLFTAPSVKSNTSVTVTATSVADTTKSASASVSVVVSGGSKVAMEVLYPPYNPNTSDYKAVATYLMNNPSVAAANFAVEWGMIDQGPGVGEQYDWSSIDSQITPWAAAGKKVNLIVWANADSTVSTCSNGTTNTTGNCAIPSYIWKALGSSNYTTCNTQYGTQQIPNYLDRTAFQIPYQQFMAATIAKYGSNPNIGYIRFGLGHGGESYPVTGWNTSGTACGNSFSAWGITVATWETYLATMMTYESTLQSGKQLMVGITPMGAPNTLVPDFVAPLAVPMSIGFGSQGLQLSDITNYPSCTADWCNLFAKYNGQVPLELQTYLQSCPDNTCTTGSLVDLVPFAVSHHASAMEIYYQDWLLAFDPSYPGNSQYGAAYAQVLTQAANTVAH